MLTSKLPHGAYTTHVYISTKKCLARQPKKGTMFLLWVLGFRGSPWGCLAPLSLSEQGGRALWWRACTAKAAPFAVDRQLTAEMEGPETRPGGHIS